MEDRKIKDVFKYILVGSITLFGLNSSTVYAASSDDKLSNKIHSIYNLNQIVYAKDDHASEYSNSYLECNYNSTRLLSYDKNNVSGLNTSLAYYPRLKKLIGKYYLLTYHRTLNGGSTFYNILKKNGSKYESINSGTISAAGRYIEEAYNGSNHVRVYNNADAVVYSENGKIKILIVETYRYDDTNTTKKTPVDGLSRGIGDNEANPVLDGIVMKIGTFDIENKNIVWDNFWNEDGTKTASGVKLSDYQKQQLTYSKDYKCNTTEKIILKGNSWEPSIVKSGNRIDVYFSAVTPYGFNSQNSLTKSLRLSSGVGLLTSYDNGENWNVCSDSGKCNTSNWRNNLKSVENSQVVKYYAKRISQQNLLKLNPKSTRIFTNQMPVATLLNNGKTALVMESKQLKRSENGNIFKLSFGRLAKGSEWKSLSSKEQGNEVNNSSKTQTQKFNVMEGAGPYIRQFPSGETILIYEARRKNDVVKDEGTKQVRVRMRIGDNNATPTSFMKKSAITVSSYSSSWSSVEISSSHIATVVGPAVIKEDNNKYAKIFLKDVVLNHRINAMKYTSISDWDKTLGDALFVGSSNPAQESLRVANDDSRIYLLSEVIDSSVYNRDAVTFYISSNDLNGGYYKLIVYRNGKNEPILRKYESDGKKFTTIDPKLITIKRYNSNKGYKLEVSIPRTMLKENNKLATNLKITTTLTNQTKSKIYNDNINGMTKTVNGKTVYKDTSKWIDLKLVQ